MNIDNDELVIDDETTNEFDDSPNEPEVSEPETVEQEAEPPKQEDEQQEFGQRVQKRIDKLVYERNIEREERQREREENEKLRERLEQLESKFHEESASKLDSDIKSRIAQLKARKAELYDEGDFHAVNDVDDEILELKLKQRESQRKEPERPTEQPTYQPENQAPVPDAQMAWLENNDWYFNPIKAQQAQHVNVTYQGLIDEGYDPTDPVTYKELDKRINPNRVTPPPTNGVDRGNTAGSSKQVKFTQSDAAKMRAWGLDPNDPDSRKEFLRNKAEQ